MMRRLGVLGSASALLASAFVAVATLGMSAAQAESFADWANISAGDSHTCGVRKNGKLYCWGYDGSNQVGDGGESSDEITSPRRIGTFEDWANASAGSAHSCGVRKNGKLYCWGSDGAGQIGDDDNPDPATTPRRIGTFEDWATVSAGYLHTCGVRKNGKLYCWGDDAYGQVGDDDNPDPATTPRRIGDFEDWATVSAGYRHTCGVRKNGKLYCWGDDAYGQVGDGDTPGAATSPRRIGTFEDWTGVSTGSSHTCGVRKNGKLYCWGYDGTGQVGDGDATGAISPRRIGTFEDWAIAAAGGQHTCGVRKNGKLYCWGYDGNGQVGDGTDDTPDTSPHRIGTLEDWSSAAAGNTHTCGIRIDGRLYCWGNDTNGQVGDGQTSSAVTAPQRI